MHVIQYITQPPPPLLLLICVYVFQFYMSAETAEPGSTSAPSAEVNITESIEAGGE